MMFELTASELKFQISPRRQDSQLCSSPHSSKRVTVAPHLMGIIPTFWESTNFKWWMSELVGAFSAPTFCCQVFYPINPTSGDKAAAWEAANLTPPFTDPDRQVSGSPPHPLLTRHRRHLRGRRHQDQDPSRLLCLPWSESTNSLLRIWLSLV